jgi:NAD(P)-dependent dehydrogenase (short-subunit alcohol dehydrogenase family)/3-hydroxymyristoyl/3-hydroxydecanoyl-(acyl carrier protein) dehydratase
VDYIDFAPYYLLLYHLNMTEGEPRNIIENRENPLTGKVALITGSSRDIGAEIAKALASDGVNIIGNYLDKQKRADGMQKTLSSTGVKSEFVQADITLGEDRNKLKNTLLNSFGGRLDYLILNAPVFSKDPADDKSPNIYLTDDLLPFMRRGGAVIFMQSVPGHYEPELRERMLNSESIKDYASVAEKKYNDELFLRKRTEEFKKQGVSLIIACPPLVEDTTNVQLVFGRKKSGGENTGFVMEGRKISAELGLPEITTKAEVGKKITELLKRQDLPMGYTEFFENIIDARNILSAWYGQEAIYVDTLQRNDEKSGIGRLVITKRHTEGHFNDDLGISVLPGHKMIEASAQVLGLIALKGKISDDSMPLFQGINGPVKFLRTVFPKDVLQIQATITDAAKRGFTGNAKIFNQNQEIVAEINGLEAIVTKKEVAKRLMGVK